MWPACCKSVSREAAVDVKPGYQTTEFWLTTLVTLWSMFGAVVPPPFNIIVPGVAVGAYSIARALAKGGVLRGTVGRDLAREP